jgi:hypothetical protein
VGQAGATRGIHKLTRGATRGNSGQEKNRLTPKPAGLGFCVYLSPLVLIVLIMEKEYPTRASQLEMERRFSILRNKIAEGMQFNSLVEFSISNFGLGKPQAGNLVRKVFKLLRSEYEKNATYEASIILEKLNDLYKISREKGDVKDCLAVLDRRIKILGLDRQVITFTQPIATPPNVNLLAPDDNPATESPAS